MNLLAEQNVDVNKVLSTLKQLRLGVIDYERTIYKSIGQKLNDDNIPFYTEYSLGKRKRIDFYVPGGIGIEVKKGKPNRQCIFEQLNKYAESNEINILILITERNITVPEIICGKPCFVISLSKLWGVAI